MLFEQELGKDAIRHASACILVALELALDAGEMPMHCHARGIRIAAGNRRQDRRVIAQRLFGT